MQYDPAFSYRKIIIFYTLLLIKYWPLNLGRCQVINCPKRIYYVTLLTFFFLFSNNSIHSGVLAVSSISIVTQYNYLYRLQIPALFHLAVRTHTHHTRDVFKTQTTEYTQLMHHVYRTARIVLSTTCELCSPHTLAPWTVLLTTTVHFHPWSTECGDKPFDQNVMVRRRRYARHLLNILLELRNNARTVTCHGARC